MNKPTTKKQGDRRKIKLWMSSNKPKLMGAFTIKGASGPQVQVISKDYVFSSLKHDSMFWIENIIE